MSDPSLTALHRRARRQLGLFQSSDAQHCGLSREQLRALRRRGLVRRLNERVYEFAGTPDSRRKRMLAALLAGGPNAVLSHSSAGWLHGLFDLRADGIDLLYPRDRARRRVKGARLRTTGNPPVDRDLVRIGPLRLTSVARTICDLAGVLDERALRLVVLDALRRDMTSADAIADCLRRMSRPPGAPTLRSILGECDPQVERTRSTWEAEALGLVRRAGVPAPVVNLVLEHPDGSPRYELDLAWPHLRFAYELQSRTFHTIRPDALKDERKRAELESEGWMIEAVSLDLVRGDPNGFVRKVREDLQRAVGSKRDGRVRGV